MRTAMPFFLGQVKCTSVSVCLNIHLWPQAWQKWDPYRRGIFWPKCVVILIRRPFMGVWSQVDDIGLAHNREDRLNDNYRTICCLFSNNMNQRKKVVGLQSQIQRYNRATLCPGKFRYVGQSQLLCCQQWGWSLSSAPLPPFPLLLLIKLPHIIAPTFIFLLQANLWEACQHKEYDKKEPELWICFGGDILKSINWRLW